MTLPTLDTPRERFVATVLVGLLAFVAVPPWPVSDGSSAPPGSPSDETAARARPASDPGLARAATPEGEAVVELALVPREIGAGEEVTFHLVNRGAVSLLTGLPFVVERWDDDAWQEVEPVEGDEASWAWPAVTARLRPGAVSAGQSWPVAPWGPAEPGHYRIVKTATYEQPDDGDVTLRVEAPFRVRE